MHPIAQWANSLNIDGFNDWYIPSMVELNHLYKNVPDLFEENWHWSSTQHAAGTAYAWLQYFNGGGQAYTSENNSSYARAVRRLPFNHSTFNLYDECDGGFYAGKYTLDGIDYALIVAPKEQGETVIIWKDENSETEGADSETDGLANTLAMLKADGIIPNPKYDPKDVAFQPDLDDVFNEKWCAEQFLQDSLLKMEERAKEYDQDSGERSMGKTVQAFNIITGHNIKESDGWLLMELLKNVRQWSTPNYHHDSALDGVAYSALKAEALAGGK